MYSVIDTYQDHWSWGSVDEEVLRLAEETTELGITVEDSFKNAASALYSAGIEAAHMVESSEDAADAPIFAKIVAILRHPTLLGEHFRQIAELQSIASGFAQIGEQASAIAGYALALHGAVETELSQITADVYELLRVLVRQTFIVVRGSIVVSSSRNPEIARRVLGADAELDRMYLDLRSAVQRAIAVQSSHVLSLQQVLLAGSRMEEIGNQAHAICRMVLQGSPPHYN